jgi:tyrosyl-tRNA synthetase
MNPMLLKKRLAREIVGFYHGEEAALQAQEGFEKQFSQKEVPEDLQEYVLPAGPHKVSKILVDCGLCASSGEAKRLIQGGGVSVDGNKINAWDAEIEISDEAILKAGKRRFVKLVTS